MTSSEQLSYEYAIVIHKQDFISGKTRCHTEELFVISCKAVSEGTVVFEKWLLAESEYKIFLAKKGGVIKNCFQILHFCVQLVGLEFRLKMMQPNRI